MNIKKITTTELQPRLSNDEQSALIATTVITNTLYGLYSEYLYKCAPNSVDRLALEARMSALEKWDEIRNIIETPLPLNNN